MEYCLKRWTMAVSMSDKGPHQMRHFLLRIGEFHQSRPSFPGRRTNIKGPCSPSELLPLYSHSAGEMVIEPSPHFPCKRSPDRVKWIWMPHGHPSSSFPSSAWPGISPDQFNLGTFNVLTSSLWPLRQAIGRKPLGPRKNNVPNKGYSTSEIHSHWCDSQPFFSAGFSDTGIAIPTPPSA